MPVPRTSSDFHTAEAGARHESSRGRLSGPIFSDVLAYYRHSLYIELHNIFFSTADNMDDSI